jgi:hypothetical protein
MNYGLWNPQPPKKLDPYRNTNLPAQLLGLVDLLESSAVGQEDIGYVVANRVFFLGY